MVSISIIGIKEICWNDIDREDDGSIGKIDITDDVIEYFTDNEKRKYRSIVLGLLPEKPRI